MVLPLNAIHAIAVSHDMYCRQCGYNLRGLERESCPECGRDFRRDDPATYAKKPPAPAWVHATALILILILIPFIIIGIILIALFALTFGGFGQ
jgi:hypothetical protein